MGEKLITQASIIHCDHLTGIVGIVASQTLVTIENVPILVKGDVKHRPIVGCPIPTGGSKPCLQTLNEKKGHSQLLFIKDKPVCLKSLEGLTDGLPSGGINYSVQSAGQNFLEEL